MPAAALRTPFAAPPVPGMLDAPMADDAPRAPQRKSLLVQIGEQAMKTALLQALTDSGWNLTKAAEALRLGSASAVIKAIQSLGLTEEYEKAKAAGAVRPGRRQS